NKEHEQRLIDDLDIFKHKSFFGERELDVRRIIDSIHFVESKNNRLMQCADLAAYFILKGVRIRQRLKDGHARDAEAQKRALLLYQWVERSGADWLKHNITRGEAPVLDFLKAFDAMTVDWRMFPGWNSAWRGVVNLNWRTEKGAWHH